MTGNYNEMNERKQNKTFDSGANEAKEHSSYEFIEEIERVVSQMAIDDIEENPQAADEYFDCACCGQYKSVAGSVLYSGDYRLCNDCVLIAETALALKKMERISDLIEAMEEKRLEEVCEFIKQDRVAHNN